MTSDIEFKKLLMEQSITLDGTGVYSGGKERLREEMVMINSHLNSERNMGLKEFDNFSSLTRNSSHV
jgi:hypothetical protein